MVNPTITLVYFFYGLAFFAMGVTILQEVGRCTDIRLRHALIYLGSFGILHGAHEWFEMFQIIGFFRGTEETFVFWEDSRLLLLAFSFLALATFGSLLLIPKPEYQRLALMVPLTLAGIWSFGLLIMHGHYEFPAFWDVLDVWTRYIMGIPSALLACLGLIAQQREFRRVGMARFGRDSLWAAIAFAWYGLAGQIFTRPSLLPPSNFLNSNLFFVLFGFQVQLLRAGAAVVAAYFVVQFLLSFAVETQRKMEDLQTARLEEARRRESVAGELLHRVVVAQEAERQRIARELHDETGQSLTALGLGLRSVASILHQNPDKASSNLRQLEGMVTRTLDELQRLISDLRPSHLDDLGLPAALRWYANDMQIRSNIKVNMEITGDQRKLPSEVKTTIFRVTQEALNNVIKHAHARNVNVRLCFDPDIVSLLVEDDGIGFDVNVITNPKRPSWGLLGMEERATLLGGNLEICTQPGQGTQVKIAIPYHRIEEVSNENPVGLGG